MFFNGAGTGGRFDPVSLTISLEILNRHSEALFEFLWCPVCGQEVFTHIPFEGVFCKNCNTQVVFRESRETRGYEEIDLYYIGLPWLCPYRSDDPLRRSPSIRWGRGIKPQTHSSEHEGEADHRHASRPERPPEPELDD